MNNIKNIKLKPVVSYATRPMRPNEQNGVEHIFISNSEAEEMIMSDDVQIAAYTKIGEYMYFVTYDQIKDLSNNLYVIDPYGIENILMNNYRDIRNYVIIHVSTSKRNRKKRAKKRPGYNRKIYKTRVSAENKQFNDFENVKIRCRFFCKPVYNIDNNNSMEESIEEFKNIILETYYPDTMYLIVGRTCSGKDTLVTKIIEEFNKCQNSV